MKCESVKPNFSIKSKTANACRCPVQVVFPDESKHAATKITAHWQTVHTQVTKAHVWLVCFLFRPPKQGCKLHWARMVVSSANCLPVRILPPPQSPTLGICPLALWRVACLSYTGNMHPKVFRSQKWQKPANAQN